MDLEKLVDAYNNPATPEATRVLIEKKRRELANNCRKSFKYFCLLILGSRYGSFYRVHQELMDFLEKGESQVVLIPRGLYKSTICSVAYPLWVILNHPDTAILLVNEVLKNPRKWISEQKEFLTNDKVYRWLFPDDVPADPRKFGTDSDWTSPRKKAPWQEASVEIASIEHAVVSRHFHLIIADDLVGESNSRTPGGIERAKEWWSRSQYLLVNNTNSIHNVASVHTKVIGTRWNYSDIYSELLESDLPSFVKKAIEEVNGRKVLLCPEVLSEKVLEDRRKASSSYDFNAQMLMSPVPADEALFKSWNNMYYKEEDLLSKPVVSRISCDFAISSNVNADYTVITCTSTDQFGNLYVREYVRGRMDPYQAMNAIYKLQEKYDAQWLLMEGSVIDKVFRYVLEDDSKRSGRHINIVPVKGSVMSSGKQARALTLQPIHEQKRLFIKHNMEELEEEMLKFPFFGHDDIVDSLTLVTASGYHVWGAVDPADRKPREYTMQWWIDRQEERDAAAFFKTPPDYDYDDPDTSEF